MKRDLQARTEPAAFQAKLAALCAGEKDAFAAASIAADVAEGIRRSAAEQNASMELDDIAAYP